uniref:Uncharacterized protein n=1 Tax=Zea mays TaxID=4577 RepID=C4IZ11_MAIZE|nr:unknown [Zea mays]
MKERKRPRRPRRAEARGRAVQIAMRGTYICRRPARGVPTSSCSRRRRTASWPARRWRSRRRRRTARTSASGGSPRWSP